MNNFKNEQWLSRQFKKVIQWYDNDTNLMFFRYDISHAEIMNGSALSVNEGQVAIVSNNGVLEVFTPGKYELSTNNKPVVSSLKNIFFKFENTDKQTIFFVPTKQFLNTKWGTKYPINIVDPKFEQVQVRAFGTFAYKVDDPIKFMKEVTSTNKEYTTDLLKDQLTSFIVEEFPSVIQRNNISVIEMSSNLSSISAGIIDEVNDNFAQLGLKMTSLTIENINLPDELQKILNARTSINMLGGVGTYTTVRTLDTMEKSVENEGTNGMAQAGIGVGMGLNMMNQFANNINGANTTFVNNTTTAICPNCNAQNNTSHKFCSNCGYKFNTPSVCECGQPITNGAKFCSNCGKSTIKVN